MMPLQWLFAVVMKTGTGSAISCTVAWSKPQFLAVPVPVFISLVVLCGGNRTCTVQMGTAVPATWCVKARQAVKSRQGCGRATGKGSAIGGGTVRQGRGVRGNGCRRQTGQGRPIPRGSRFARQSASYGKRLRARPKPLGRSGSPKIPLARCLIVSGRDLQLS